MTDTLEHRIRLVRRDLGSLLFHFTRARETSVDEEEAIPGGVWRYSWGGTAYSVLEKILDDGRLLGGTQYIRGRYRCVCWTEAPISELAALFSLVTIAAHPDERPRYAPYGVAVPKSWLFERGGRPVIYQSDAEFDVLPEEIRYRHVRYEPHAGTDLTWEREWRLKADELVLDPKNTLVVVPTAEEAYQITYGKAEPEPNGWDPDSGPYGVYHRPRWMAVSLDLFGLDVEA